MTYMFELYYGPPRNVVREEHAAEIVGEFGGRLDYWEDANGFTGICLTFEFDNLAQAEAAMQPFRDVGKHVEGPYPYGD